jgi:RES domain-containing protein
VSLNARLYPWTGVGYRHLPSDIPADGVLDFSYLGLSRTNRWSSYGEKTLYLAGDMGVAVSEWGRYLDIGRTPSLGRQAATRMAYRLDVVVDRVLDLRDPEVWSDLSLTNAPACFLQIEIARATAHFIRRTTDAQGLFVPSVAMRDKLDRWNLVLFVEKLPEDPARFITRVAVAGPMSVGAAP